MAGKMIYPLDPYCPVVESTLSCWREDSLMMESGCLGEFVADFEREHRRECQRCTVWGLENADVEYN